jgi:hypothetical protein
LDRAAIELSIEEDALPQPDHDLFAMKLTNGAFLRAQLMNVKSDRVCPKVNDRDPHSVILSTFRAAKKESAKFNRNKMRKKF